MIHRIYSPDVMRSLVSPLIQDHFLEVGNTKVYELAPDWDKYDAIHKAGGLLMLAAYAKGDCIGYSINFLTPHVHYVNQNICYNDVLFVSKEHRNGSAGGRLIIATTKAARSAGARVMQWHAKPNTALDEVLSKRVPLFEHAYAEAL